jgi:hypothetical protein
LRDVATRKRHFPTISQREKAIKKTIDPALREIARQSQREKNGERLASHGGNIAKTAHQAAVPDCGSRMPLPSEMNIFKAEIGGDEQFVTARGLKHGAIIPDAARNRPRLRSRTAPDALN